VPLRSPAVDAISLSLPATRITARTETAIPTALREAAARAHAARPLLAP